MIANWADRLLREVIAIPSRLNLVNFLDDSSDAVGNFLTNPSQRRDRLDQHVRQVANGDLVLVGEAAGWRGARQSGVAFTDAPTVGLIGNKEPSATAVQGALREHGLAGRALLWNALPLHPHDPGNPRSNRTPTLPETFIGTECLALATDHRFIICVGRTAAGAVSRLRNERVPGVSDFNSSSRAVAVRHPSYGGANIFRTELAYVLQEVSLI